MDQTVAEHLACPLLRADSQYFQPGMWGVIQGYDANLGQFLKDATEWGGLVLFDGLSNPPSCCDGHALDSNF